jgi:hypothetical protein
MELFSGISGMEKEVMKHQAAQKSDPHKRRSYTDIADKLTTA